MEIIDPITQIEDIRSRLGEAKTVHVLAALRYLDDKIAAVRAELAMVNAKLIRLEDERKGGRKK